VALAAQRASVPWTDDESLGRLVPELEIGFRWTSGRNRVLLGGEDVSDAIRTPMISQGASIVSARPVVRAGLLELQRRLACRAPTGAVLEGRDIGTVVFPEAQVKIFITASDEVRARRRLAELSARGIATTFEQVLSEQRQRDLGDRSRAVAPLKPAPNALQLDTSSLTLEQVIGRVLEVVAQARSRA
jgi:cytidylate kinase